MNRSLRINVRDLVWLIVANVIIWQNALLRVSSLFRYTDELLTLFFIAVIVINLNKLNADQIKLFLLLALLLSLGVISTLMSDIQRPGQAIILDVLYFSKFHICFVGASLYFKRNGGLKRMSRLLAAEIQGISLIGVILAALSQIVNIGMTYKARYGIKAFQFIYSSPGMLSQYCIIFLMILAVDLNNEGKKLTKYLFMFLLFLMWGSTVRARGIATIMIWLLLMAISNSEAFKKDDKLTVRKRIKMLLKPQYILLGAAAALCVGFDQLEHYLGGSSITARSLLFRGGVSVIRDYFPLGAGFATFGTEMAAQHYSPLYYRYGLNTYWALKEGGTELTDCFWPAVGAEFGVFGVIVMALMVVIICRMLIKMSRSSRFNIVAALTYIAYLLISSAATSVFTAYTTTGFIVLIIGLMTVDPEKHSKRPARQECPNDG